MQQRRKEIRLPVTVAVACDRMVNVIIKTPRGSRNKLKFDEQMECYRLGSVLPAGLAFPYDFGFVPGTKAEDGDPLDVLLLMDELAFPGCLVTARLVDVLKAEQTEKDGKTIRNDRLVAVAEDAEVANLAKNQFLANMSHELHSVFQQPDESENEHRLIVKRTAHLAPNQSSLTPVFDPRLAISRCCSSPSMVRDMMAYFLDDVNNVLPNLRSALEKGDLVQVGRLGHRIKGTDIYLGAQPAEDAAARVECIGDSSGVSLSEAAKAIDLLDYECRALRAALSSRPLAAEFSRQQPT